MRVKDCIQQIRERGDARAHECSSVNVGFEPGCLASRLAGCLASRVTKVQFVLPKAECTSLRKVLRTPDIQCLQQVIYAMSITTPFAVIVDNAGFQTKGVNCRLVETRAKWR